MQIWNCLWSILMIFFVVCLRGCGRSILMLHYFPMVFLNKFGWFMSCPEPWPFFYRCARSEKIEFCHASGMKKYSNLSEADDNMTWQQMSLWAIQCYFNQSQLFFYPWVLVFFNVCKFSLKNWGTSIFVLHYGRASFKQFLGVFWWRSKWLVPGPSWFPISRCQSGSWESTEGGDSMSRSQLNSNEA